MPLYEYTCDACHHDFELLIRSSADKPACPQCGSSRLAKHFSVPAAHVRGTSSLPICETPRGGTCGLPQCGLGGCQFDG